MVTLVAATIFGSFLWDRLCTMIFAPRIFKAMLDEAGKTTLADFLPVVGTAFKIAAGLMILGTGNILVMGLAAWWYFQKPKAQQPTTTA